MSGAMIIFKATGKVLLNFLPATVFIVVGLAYLAYKEKRDLSAATEKVK